MTASTSPRATSIPSASRSAPPPAGEPPFTGLDRVDLLLAAAFTAGSVAMMLALF